MVELLEILYGNLEIKDIDCLYVGDYIKNI
jgi:hypothetical protein